MEAESTPHCVKGGCCSIHERLTEDPARTWSTRRKIEAERESEREILWGVMLWAEVGTW